LTCTVTQGVAFVAMKIDGTLLRVGPNTFDAFWTIHEI
jgi:hypothetical protein